MFFNEDTRIVSLAVHRVGSQMDPEGGIMISPNALTIPIEMNEDLTEFFISPFKQEAYYHFMPEIEGQQNTTYQLVMSILNDENLLHPQSVLLAKSLYAMSASENITKGEFYVIKFRNCCYEGQLVDAVGLFKVEKKEIFLHTSTENNQLNIQLQYGNGLGKIDKGCLAFNTDGDGCVAVAFDKATRGDNAFYWIDSFLGLQQNEDEFFQTQQVINMCHDFVKNQLPQQYNITKDQQADLLNRSMQFFKENEDFSMEDYTEDVIQQEDIINNFKSFKTDFEQSRGFKVAEEFNISEPAVKKMAKIMKSVIKLDKNFHVYVHGKRDFIRRGFDEEMGMQFYQLYFTEEE